MNCAIKITAIDAITAFFDGKNYFQPPCILYLLIYAE